MLDCYVGECMGMNNQHKNGIKEPTYGYQSCNNSQTLVFGGYVKVRGSLYTQVIIWMNTILNHIDTRANLPKYEGSCMVYRSKWYRKQKYRQIPPPISIETMWEPHCRYSNGIKK